MNFFSPVKDEGFPKQRLGNYIIHRHWVLTETFIHLPIMKTNWEEVTHTRVLLCMFYCRPKHRCSASHKCMQSRFNKISQSQGPHKLCTVMHGQDLDLLLFACGASRGGAGGGGGGERGHLHLITAPAAPLLGDYIVLDTLLQFKGFIHVNSHLISRDSWCSY